MMRMTQTGNRVGPKMHRAIELVNKYGAFDSKNQLAIKVGPNGSQRYGYQIVNRCIKKDLLAIDPDHDTATSQGLGAVLITDKGQRYLEMYD